MAIYLITVFLILSNILGEHFWTDASPTDGKYSLSAPNIAIGGTSTQSSTYAYYGNARNANDGSLENNYLRSQCSYTEKELNPWWMVNLKNRYQIFSVAVTNRVLECCKERLYGAEIRIGNNPNNGGTSNPRCGTIPKIESGQTISFSCEGMIGKYVTVTIPGREEHLILCEVQVYGLPASNTDIEQEEGEPFKTPNGAPNVAVNGVSTQSSIYNMYGESKNAIDGSLSSNYLFIQCAGTSEQDNPWWMVDLKATHKVFTVTVTNRGDCCAERINGAQIRIGNSAENGGTNNPICGIIPKMNNGETLAFECDGMLGQYVTVNIPGRNKSLTICEVQVFGLLNEDAEIEQQQEDETMIFEDHIPGPFRLYDDLFDYYNEDTESIDIKEDEGINLAFRGISSQSSTYDLFGAAENAIDGSQSTRYMSSHCSHTDLDIEPWWRLDLTKIYYVNRLNITNRGDCCNERINGAEIRIGTSPERGGTKNPKCAKIESMDLGEEKEFICDMVGRYVTITIPGKAAYLTLCEVKLYGNEVSGNYTDIPVFEDSQEHHEANEMRKIMAHSNAASNVALKGVTSQSSTYGAGDPKKAADGSLKNKDPETQCAKTKENLDSWWTLDLQSDHKVSSIAITSRADCCEEDLEGAEIHIGNSATGWKKNPICGTVFSIGLGETFSFNCDGMQGRFVTIVIPDKNKSLTLCEVQVFAVPIDNPTGEEWDGDFEMQKQHHGVKNIAPQGISSQSSHFGSRLEARTAIDGSLASNYLLGECTHTKKEKNPWWKLDLKSKMVVQSVAITNRGDCCRERINGAKILIGNSAENGGINNPRCGFVYKMYYGETMSFNCKGMEGRYVTVTLPDIEEFLSVCEVQVFAHPAKIQDLLPSPHSDEILASTEKNQEITKDLRGNAFFFPGESDNSVVYLSPQQPMNLKAFTLCMRLSLNVSENRETILFSYRTKYFDELNLWIESNGKIGFYMSGEGVFFPPINKKNEWNHLCLTWESKYGRTELWLNGRRKPMQVYNRRHQVRHGGIAIVGQDQDSLGEGFDASQSYIGKIKDLNMWNRVISLKALRAGFRNKDVQKGNIFDWGSLTYTIKGNVKIV